MKKILITGFEPFGSSRDNNSWTIAQEIYKSWKKIQHPTFELFIEEIPVSWSKSGPALDKAVAKYQPDHLISLGLYKGINFLLFEFAARNEAIAMQDNDYELFGNDQKGTISPMYQEYDDYYTNTLPSQWFLDHYSGFVNFSSDAGGYLCNFLFFHAMTRYPEISNKGFIHVTGNTTQNDACVEVLFALANHLATSDDIIV